MRPDDQLLAAAQELLQKIDDCFLYDADFTRKLEFNSIQSALMADGAVPIGTGRNIEHLEQAMLEFRLELGKSLASSVDPCAATRPMARLYTEADRRVNQCLFGQDVAPEELG